MSPLDLASLDGSNGFRFDIDCDGEIDRGGRIDGSLGRGYSGAEILELNGRNFDESFPCISGAQTGVISTTDLDAARLVRKAKEYPTLVGRDLVREVTCVSPYDWHQGRWGLESGYETAKDTTRFVVAYDYGIKWNILRNLASAGCGVRIVPASTPAEDVLDMNPDGIFLSNGPGDPDAVTYAIDNVAKLVGKKPVFGICLGHQILGLALGGKTYKLKFGHHGGNQPVMDLTTRKVEITAQNHGFAVDVDSLQGLAELTHINLNDKTVEGLQVPSKQAFSVQYHPEASPGPHDANYLFKRFMDLIDKGEM